MPVYNSTTAAYVGTYDGHGPEYWTDLEPNSFFKDPNILIPAADVTRYKEDQDLWDLHRRERRVIYTETLANGVTYKYRLNLTFFVVPASTTALTIGGTAGPATGTIGRCISNLCVLSTAAATHADTAGFSLGKYFTVGVDDFGQAAVGPYAVTSLAEDAFVVSALDDGMGVWLVRSGTVVVDTSGAITVGDTLTFAAAGEDIVATSPSGTTSVVQIEDYAGIGMLGTALCTNTTDGLSLAEINMPERYSDNIEGSGIPDASVT